MFKQRIHHLTASGSRLTCVVSACVAAAAGLFAGAAALAAEPSAAARSEQPLLEEIVIIGTKRAQAEELQKAAVAATVVTEETLKATNATDLIQMSAMIPNASFRESGTYPGTQRFWMRGTGTNFTVPNFDPAVSVYQDGIFVAQNVAAILDTFDTESIEVYRGPQGTLFGRNASSGAVLTRSRRPGDKLDIRADAIFGSFNREDFSGSIGGPVTSTLGLKAAYISRSTGGWLQNTFDGSKRGASYSRHFRGTAVWKPSDKVDLTLIGEHFSRSGDGSWAVSMGNCDLRPCTATGEPNRAWNQVWDDNRPFVSNNQSRVNKQIAELNVDLGHGVLTSISGWIDLETFNGGQFDGVPAFTTATMNMIKQHQFSEELRYASKFSEKFDFTAGLYYFQQSLRYGEMRADGTRIGRAQGGVTDPLNPFGLRGPGYSELEHISRGAFAEAHWNLSPKFTLTAGARYSNEDKNAEIGIVNGSSCNSYQVPPFYVDAFSCSRGAAGGFDIKDRQGWSDFSPKLALQFQQNDNMMYYGSLSRGFRSGGFSMRVAATELNNPAVPRPSFYEGERVDQLELGMKADWWSGRARTNLTAFYQKWKDIQRTIQVGIQVQKTANVADSHVSGIELESNLILGQSLLRGGDKFRFDAAIGRIWTSYDSPYVVGALAPATGTVDLRNQFFAAPYMTAYGALTYELPVGANSGKLAFRTSYDFVSRWYTEGPIRPTLIGYYRSKNLVDADIDYTSQSGKWSVKFFGKNLTDRQFWEVLVPADDVSGIAVPGAPRTYGLQVSLKL